MDKMIFQWRPLLPDQLVAVMIKRGVSRTQRGFDEHHHNIHICRTKGSNMPIGAPADVS